MAELPKPVEMPFIDGVRSVPGYVAALFKHHKILTHQLTYDQAVARMNDANLHQHVMGKFTAMKEDHLRNYGR